MVEAKLPKRVALLVACGIVLAPPTLPAAAAVRRLGRYVRSLGR